MKHKKHTSQLVTILFSTIFFFPLFVLGQSLEVSVEKRDISTSISKSGLIRLSVEGGTAPYTYTWSNERTGKEIGGLSSGIYTVTITDNNQQQRIEKITISNKVKWDDITGVEVKGEKIIKEEAKGWGNAGLISTNTLLEGKNGFLEIKITKTGAVYMMGFSSNNKDEHYRSIDKALYIADQRVYIFESGRRKGYMGKINNGDVLKIQKSGSTIVYSKNGKNYFKSSIDKNLVLKIDASVHRGTIDADIVTSFENTTDKNHSYAVLQMKLNSNFYLVKNDKLFFKYKEIYSSGQLNFNVFNKSETVVLNDKTLNVLINNQTNNGQKKIGDNEFELDVSSLAKDAYYLLIIENEKKQKSKLRFYIP